MTKRLLQENILLHLKPDIKLILKQIIEDKLSTSKTKLPPPIIDQFVENVMIGKDDAFSYNDEKGNKKEIDISFSEEDFLKFELSLEDATSRMPKLIPAIIKSSSADLLKDLHSSWLNEKRLQKNEFSAFQGRLENSYKEGFDLLRIMLTSVRELGNEFFKRQQQFEQKNNSILNDTILRLHVRACQVASEIITLLENGYPDGAMARWRTLYEINVVSTIISAGGENLAQRYVDHQIVDSYKAMKLYGECSPQLGFKPLSRKEETKIQRLYDDIIQKWGKPFSGSNGWASDFLQNKDPKWKDLEASANQLGMRSYYKLASWGVHAGSKGLFFKLGSIDNEDNLLAGATNYGFTEPAQNTALSLYQITALLLGKETDMEDTIILNTLILIKKAVPKAFLKAEAKIKKAHLTLQKKA